MEICGYLRTQCHDLFTAVWIQMNLTFVSGVPQQMNSSWVLHVTTK